MVWINPLIAVSLKARLPEGYCNAWARCALFLDATAVAVALIAWARHRCLQLYSGWLTFQFVDMTWLDSDDKYNILCWVSILEIITMFRMKSSYLKI